MGFLKRAVLLCLVAVSSWAAVSSKLNIEETDGDPSTFPYKLKVSAGSLTDNGDGTATLTTTGGGGGGGASGTVNAASQYSVGYYSGAGSTTTISGDSKFQWDGTSVTLNAPMFMGNGSSSPMLNIKIPTGNTNTSIRMAGVAGGAGTIDYGITLATTTYFFRMRLTNSNLNSGVTEKRYRAGLNLEDADGRVQAYFPSTGGAVLNSTGSLTFYDGPTTHFIAMKASDTIATNMTVTLPSADGTAGQSLVTDGTSKWYFDNPKTTATANSVIYASGSGYLTGNSSFTWNTAPGGAAWSPSLTMMSMNAYPGIDFHSNNAMGINFFETTGVANADLGGAYNFHPNNFPAIAQGNVNGYVRDGGNYMIDFTGQGAETRGVFAVRYAAPSYEATPFTALQVNSTGQTLLTNMRESVDGFTGDRFLPMEPTALFQTSSTIMGSIPCPRMTTAQRDAITAPANGLCIYNVTLSTYNFYNNSAWTVLGGGGGGAGGSGTPGTPVGSLQYNSASSFAGVAGSFVTASSITYSGAVNVSSLAVNAFNNLSRLDVSLNVPDSASPSGITGAVSDNHAAMFFGDTSLTVNRKMGIEWTGYRSGGTGYAYGGLFGHMTDSSGNTVGALTVDMRANKDHTALTEFVRFTSSGTVGISTAAPQATLDVNGTVLVRSSMGVTGSAQSVVSYGLSVGSLTVTGSGAGEVDLTEGSAPSGIAGKDVLYADSTLNSLKFIPNNGSTFAVVGTSITPVNGNCVKWLNGYGVGDAGAACGSGSGGGGGYALQPATVTIQGDKGVTASTITAYTTLVTTNFVLYKSTTNLEIGRWDNTQMVAGDFMLSISSVPGATGGSSSAPNFFGVNTYGHVVSSGTVPVLTSCGATPAITGTDFAGTVTGGTGSTGCTVTFASPFVNDPVCTATPQTGSVVNTFSYTHSATALTITETGLGTGKFDYVCIGNKG